MLTDLPPMVPPRPEAERPVIDYDRLVGYSHAQKLIENLPFTRLTSNA